MNQSADEYCHLKFINHKKIMKEQFTCPECHKINTLEVSDSFLSGSTKYYGIKYECNYCLENFICIDSACLPRKVNAEMENHSLFRVEFFLGDLESAIVSES